MASIGHQTQPKPRLSGDKKIKSTPDTSNECSAETKKRANTGYNVRCVISAVNLLLIVVVIVVILIYFGSYYLNPYQRNLKVDDVDHAATADGVDHAATADDVDHAATADKITAFKSKLLADPYVRTQLGTVKYAVHLYDGFEGEEGDVSGYDWKTLPHGMQYIDEKPANPAFWTSPLVEQRSALGQIELTCTHLKEWEKENGLKGAIYEVSDSANVKEFETVSEVMDFFRLPENADLRNRDQAFRSSREWVSVSINYSKLFERFDAVRCRSNVADSRQPLNFWDYISEVWGNGRHLKSVAAVKVRDGVLEITEVFA